MADRLYTTAELDAMEREAQSQGMAPEATRAAAEGLHDTGNFMEGAGAALKRTVLGLQQAKEYLTGDDASREAVNQAIKALEAHPSLQTPSGKVGEMVGTAAQFAGPQGAASAVSKVLPKAVVKGARTVLGNPGSVTRAAGQGATYEATQPVNPPDTGTDEYLIRKAAQIGIGGASGAGAGVVANALTREGLAVPASRQPMMTEAKRLGVDKLITPAQRTGSPELQEYELGKRSQAGAAGLFTDRDRAMQAKLERTAAQAIGSPEAAPTEHALATQWAKALQGYASMQSIPKMGIDVPYWDALKAIHDDTVIKAASPTTVAMADKILKATSKMSGDDFLHQLQNVRSMAFAAKRANDPAKADSFNALATVMEDYAERRVSALAGKGKIAPDALVQLRNARTELAKIHAVESATDPTTGRISAEKFLKGERHRTPAHAGASTSPVSQGLSDVGALSRVIAQANAPGAGQGYGNLMAGRQIASTIENPVTAPFKLPGLAKNYLAAKYYLAHGGNPGFIAAHTSPVQNMYARRLIPGLGFSAQEGLTE
ncbi:MAG: hypothetical protein KGL39_18750 [Patescibacteria group bacterium]|nr:hypothetical protein [Patescibacteria group bacterium]